VPKLALEKHTIRLCGILKVYVKIVKVKVAAYSSLRSGGGCLDGGTGL
jgi:hypothetical protein